MGALSCTCHQLPLSFILAVMHSLVLSWALNWVPFSLPTLNWLLIEISIIAGVMHSMCYSLVAEPGLLFTGSWASFHHWLSSSKFCQFNVSVRMSPRDLIRSCHAMPIILQLWQPVLALQQPGTWNQTLHRSGCLHSSHQKWLTYLQASLVIVLHPQGQWGIEWLPMARWESGAGDSVFEVPLQLFSSIINSNRKVVRLI